MKGSAFRLGRLARRLLAGVVAHSLRHVGRSTCSFCSSCTLYALHRPTTKMPRTALRDYWPRTTLVKDVKAALFEFVGTTVFLLLAFGGTQASHEVQGSALEQSLYIATAFGLSLLVSAWFFFRATGGLFNPDVSLALLLCGCIGPTRFVLYCIAQMTGAIAAAAIILGLTPGPMTYNPVLAPNVNRAQGVFIEMFITSALCLAVLMLAAEKHSSTPFAPIGVGLTLFACHLFAVPYTGAAMNTARAFGPAAVSGFPNDSHWIYWLGPFLGSLLATTFYVILKHYQYWTLNPGQEATEPKLSPRDPVSVIRADDERGGMNRGNVV